MQPTSKLPNGYEMRSQILKSEISNPRPSTFSLQPSTNPVAGKVNAVGPCYTAPMALKPSQFPERRRSRSGPIAAPAIVLGIYLLSYGPAVWLATNWYVRPKVVYRAYSPIFWVQEYVPPLQWYHDLWYGHGPPSLIDGDWRNRNAVPDGS
jgi:hypothetical protein